MIPKCEPMAASSNHSDTIVQHAASTQLRSACCMQTKARPKQALHSAQLHTM